jgi:AbrB family looped-hinge helix DNA binding protein
MTERETIKMGKRGTLTLPAWLRRRFGLADGSLVIAEVQEEGILIRPAEALPVEIYSSERIAEFLLNNAVDREHYQRQREEVRKMGLDPDAIPHHRPE